MFQQTDFFDEENYSEQGSLGAFGGTVGKWLGFGTLVTVLMFTAVHGISATLQYQAHGTLGKFAGVAGIITTEMVILAIVLKWHNRRISGDTQRLVALITLGVGVVLVALATVTDSWLNATKILHPWLAFYLGWVLPISPIIMGTLAHVVDELEPEQLWSQKQASAERDLREQKFHAYVANRKAELGAVKEIVNANLNARVMAAKQIAAHYQSDEVQQAITSSALNSVPALLRSIGVDTSVLDTNHDGTLSAEEVSSYLSQNPDIAARLFGTLARQGDGATIEVQEPLPHQTIVDEPIVYVNGQPAPNFTNGNGQRNG